MNTPPAERVVSGSPQDGGKGFQPSHRHSLSNTEHEHVNDHVNDHVFRQRPVAVDVPRIDVLVLMVVDGLSLARNNRKTWEPVRY
jgi:hypothetical protein